MEKIQVPWPNNCHTFPFQIEELGDQIVGFKDIENAERIWPNIGVITYFCCYPPKVRL